MTTSAWTDDRIDRLKILWRQGRTAEQIARDLQNGISRSAVLGKVYRLGLSYHARAPRERAAPKSATVSQAVRALTPMPDVRVSISPEARGAATLMSVKPRQCRWPLGDPLRADFTLCGDAVARGAYCAHHAAMAYRPAPALGPSLERLARLL